MITQVSTGIFRGPQPGVKEFYALKDLGVHWMLDLETGLFDGDPAGENDLAAAFGIQVLKYPLGEFFPPSNDDLKSTCEIIEHYKPIYVHCRTGVDRTGMVIANYRMRVEGVPRAAAIAEMKGAGMHLWYYWWAWFL